MKKSFKLIGLLSVMFFSISVFAQSFTADMSKLGEQNKRWNEINLPNLLKKTPYSPRDISQEQLNDKSFPNSVEINEINKSIEERNRYTIEYGKIVRMYISPPEAAEALFNNSKNTTTKINAASIQLRDGKINFGQYNQIKQQLFKEAMANSKSIVEQYNLSSQLSPTQSQQAPQRQIAPNQSSSSQNTPATISDITCQTHEMVMLNQILPFRQQGIMTVGEAERQFNDEEDAKTRVFLKKFVREMYADPAMGEKILRSGGFRSVCAKINRGY